MVARQPSRLLRAAETVLREAASLQNLDLSLLAVLLILTAAFGRPFSKLTLGLHLYVTEAFIAAIVVTTARRHGFKGLVGTVRRSLPVVLVVVYWVAGAIATARGLAAFGLRDVEHDVGLVEYSVFLPLTAVVADTPQRVLQLIRVLYVAGAVTMASFTVVIFFFPFSRLGVVVNPEVAVGIYLSLLALPILVRTIDRSRISMWEFAVSTFTVFLMLLAGARSIRLALAMSLLAAFLVQPLRRVWRGTLVIAGIFIIAAAGYELGKGHIAQQSAPAPPAVSATSSRSLSVLTAGPVHTVNYRARSDGAGFASTVVGRTAAADTNGDAANEQWRLAFWKELLRRSVHKPVFGVGFGKPADFVWHTVVYDARVGDAANPFDVTPPHNSFVNVIYRMGLVGIIPLLALIGMAFRSAFRFRRAADETWRVTITGVGVCLVFTIVIASFNVALEGPYMSMFFWTLLGLLFVIPRVIAPGCGVDVTA